MVLNPATSLEQNVIHHGVNKTLTEESLRHRFGKISDKFFEGEENAIGSDLNIFSTNLLSFYLFF